MNLNRTFLLHLNKSFPCLSIISKYSLSVKTNEELPRAIATKKSKFIRQDYVETLANLLNIHKNQAIDIIFENESLSKKSTQKLSENLEILLKHNVKLSTIVDYPRILGEKILEQKLKLISKFPYEINETVYLVRLSPSKLKHLFVEGVTERMKLFEELLEMDVKTTSKAFAERSFLVLMPLERIRRAAKLLIDYQVSIENIRNDWWVLQYAPKQIEERMQLAHEYKISEIKTWMVRCDLDILHKYVQRRSDNKLILGDNTLLEYLSNRLDCSMEEAKDLTNRLPVLKTKSMKKIQEMIDFLYGYGFKPDHICRVPKILLHSVHTTQKRIIELEKLNIKIQSLHLLTKSHKQYMQCFQSLEKKKTVLQDKDLN